MMSVTVSSDFVRSDVPSRPVSEMRSPLVSEVLEALGEHARRMTSALESGAADEQDSLTATGSERGGLLSRAISSANESDNEHEEKFSRSQTIKSNCNKS